MSPSTIAALLVITFAITFALLEFKIPEKIRDEYRVRKARRAYRKLVTSIHESTMDRLRKRAELKGELIRIGDVQVKEKSWDSAEKGRRLVANLVFVDTVRDTKEDFEVEFDISNGALPTWRDEKSGDVFFCGHTIPQIMELYRRRAEFAHQ